MFDNIFAFLKKIKVPDIPFSFFWRTSRVVGIDVGVHSVKVAELDSEGGRAVLKTYGELLGKSYLKEGGGGGGGFLQYHDDEILQILTEVLRASSVKAKDAVFGIPSASSFITTLTLPRLSSDELEKAIPFEARKFVPVPIKDVVLDWQILETASDGEHVEVLLVAVPKDVITRIEGIAARAGLRLRGTEIESFSIIRSVLKNDFTPTAIIHIGHQSSVVLISDNGELRVSHTVGRGSNEWTRALERGLGISADRAEEIKKEIGLSERIEEREISATIRPLVDAFFLEVDRIFSFYHRKTGRRVQKIEFSGSGSSLKGVIEAAVMHFEIEVKRANPFLKVVTPPSMEDILEEIGPSFTVAVGLALREISSR
ncbi:MAG: hypothetical protein A2847_02740 [Candidatus Sungbacteria bacterium RIFCSPHIGHO2_01_FULL_50_25]|uniref:SHS2 domain-containing protein n=1 Tax=Candidatus Sungbacteria bacterium RIFCSPHIGHO2_01_FULL_50_25 TaxID=1802265 RepID=A0A1G2KEM5_9BACT|nr:MAG: hypothetical protein A2847_02740 [Candidatus Sungbacteria bacterium RIFCSPHIGHO2_01_FULL_50_25]